MTSEELRAAAERIRRFKSGEHPFAIYGEDDAATQGWHDRKILAEAYIAEHPADDETGLSVEWMTAVGFRQTGAGWWRVGKHGRETLALDYHDNTESGDVFSLPTNRFMPLRVLVATRGQLRRLCAALGVPLNNPAPATVGECTPAR